MPVTFSWRSDTTTAYTLNGASAYRGLGGTTLTAMGLAINNSNVGITANGSAIGGLELDCSSENNKQLNFPGAANLGSTGKVSILIRYRGPTSTNGHLLTIGGPRYINNISVSTQISGNMVAAHTNESAVAVVNNTLTSLTTLNTSTAAYVDFVMTYDFHTITASCVSYFNATATATINGSQNFLTTTSTHAGTLAKALDPITLFQGPVQSNWRGYINEIVIWDELITPSSIVLVDGTTGITSTGSLNGVRTGWVDCVKFNGGLWTSITATNIRNAIQQVQAGFTQTGTFAGETWSTITAAQIATGVNQIQNGTTVTGTLLYPVAMSGTAGTVDIANIKENIRLILHSNNTSTGAPVTDLSGSVSNRVKDVYKIHPEKILLGGHQMPAITTYLTSKNITAKTIAANQVAAKREAELTFSIVGLVTNQIVPNTYTSDQLDDDIEYLMENVEKVMRSYGDIGGYTRWSFPNSVTYHSSSLDERNQLRVGILDLQCKVFY